MQLTVYLAIASLALMPLVSAGCFNDRGEDWGNKAPAFAAARKLCNTKLSGGYREVETKHRCVNGNGKKFDFSIRNISGNFRKLSSRECYDGLQKEIHGCSHGGRTAYTNWEYT